MGTRSEAVDAYIAKAQPFAQPILSHLRDVVHAACPDAEEALKWGMPSFMYRGSILCTMASFKAHCGFGFWLGAQVVEGTSSGESGESAMGQFGRITAVKDLPPKTTLARYVKKAMALTEGSGKVVKAAKPAPRTKAAALTVPPELLKALEQHPEAKATFDAFSPSHRREYVDWVAEAKREETRERRIQQAIELMAEGKSRNWKYERKS
jgi:uncharacterized protein YdeI (YjbR/CyaY-like superfamily)